MIGTNDTTTSQHEAFGSAPFLKSTDGLRKYAKRSAYGSYVLIEETFSGNAEYSISNSNLLDAEDIERWNYKPCTEAEFMEFYQQALNAIKFSINN